MNAVKSASLTIFIALVALLALYVGYLVLKTIPADLIAWGAFFVLFMASMVLLAISGERALKQYHTGRP